jgi:hypothetical protein
MLYELFNNNASNKDKLKRIKQIMDEWLIHLANLLTSREVLCN